MTSERSVRQLLDQADKAVKEARRKPNLSKVPEEAYFVVRTLLREVFPEDALEGDEASWWVPQEKNMTLQTACMKFKVAGVGHAQLAELILKDNPRINAALALGNMTDNQFVAMQNRFAEAILPNYPANYRETVGAVAKK